MPYRLNWCSAYMDCIEEKVITSVINKYMTFTYKPNKTKKVAVYSAELDTFYTTSLREHVARKYDWRDYVDGCVAVLAQRGFNLKVGATIYVDNDLPSGMGLGSSACFIIGIIKALLDVNKVKYYYNTSDDRLDDDEIVAAAYEVEHDYLHIPCGLMDFKAVMHPQGIWLIDTSMAFLGEDELIFSDKLAISLINYKDYDYKHNHLANMRFNRTVAEFTAYLRYKEEMEKLAKKVYIFPVIKYIEAQRKNIANFVNLFTHWNQPKYPDVICSIILTHGNAALNEFLGTSRFTEIMGVQALGSGIGGYGFYVNLDPNRFISSSSDKYNVIYCHTL